MTLPGSGCVVTTDIRKTKPATALPNGPPQSPDPPVEGRLKKDGMYLLKAGRFHINLAYTQFIHEEREDLFSIFSEGANQRCAKLS